MLVGAANLRTSRIPLEKGALLFFDLKRTNCLQFCFHSRAAQKIQHLLVLPTPENTKRLDKYVKLLQTGSIASGALGIEHYLRANEG